MADTLKRYWIARVGFDGHEVTAPSAGAARYSTYRAWREAGYGRSVSFGDFLKRIETFHHLGRAA